MSKDTIYRQAAIDEIEYELEMINSALDSITLDFNARERLRQRRGEAREILNSIQQLPSAQPEPIRINLNEPIKVKLTDWGKEIYYTNTTGQTRSQEERYANRSFRKKTKTDIRNFSCGASLSYMECIWA